MVDFLSMDDCHKPWPHAGRSSEAAWTLSLVHEEEEEEEPNKRWSLESTARWLVVIGSGVANNNRYPSPFFSIRSSLPFCLDPLILLDARRSSLL
jgi:hypothetical protein